MTVTLRLPSGLAFVDAPRMLKAKFKQWAWDSYDGNPVSDWNRIGKADIDRVYQLGSRTPRIAYQTMLERQGEAIAKSLAELPHAALEDVNLEDPRLRRPLWELFDILLRTKSIKLAGATKLLFPFRPALIPVIDSVVANYYWYATSLRNENRFRELVQTPMSDRPAEHLLLLLQLIRDDVIGARAEIDAVRQTFADEPYAKASRIRIVESLIWYYYAGRDQA